MNILFTHQRFLIVIIFMMMMQHSIAAYITYNNIYYLTDDTNHTASVTFKGVDLDEQDGWMYYEANELYVGEVTIPDSFFYNNTYYVVNSIADNAFAGSKQMETLTIPASITTIGDGVFTLCNSLSKISINEENTSFFTYNNVMYTKNPFEFYFAPRALSGTIILHDDLKVLPSSAFQNCTLIDAVVLPDQLTTIKDGAFDHCSALCEITFGKGLVSIERNAFSNCTYLQIVTLPNSVKSIGNCAFDGCTDLVWITLGDSLKSIGRNAFYNCGLYEITLPQTLTQIDEDAFKGCENLSSITNYSPLYLEQGSTANGYVAYYATNIYQNASMVIDHSISQPIYYLKDGCIQVSNQTDTPLFIFQLDGTLIGQIDSKNYAIQVGKGTYIIKNRCYTTKLVIP